MPKKRIRLTGQKKAHAQLMHAQKRAAERFGIILTKAYLLEIAEKIKAGKGKFIEKQSCSRSLWEVYLEEHDITVKCAYDKVRHVIRTIMFPGDAPERIEDDESLV